MVKILSNGDIVPDDDPRAQAANNRSGSGNGPRQPMGHVQHVDYGQNMQQGQGMYMGGQQVSVFESLNQRLLALGIPRFNIAQWTIEPIVSVGFLLAGIFFGLPGLIFAGLLFIVSKVSQPGGNPFGGWTQPAAGAARGNQPRGDGGGGGDGFGGSGGGHRLGRS